MITFKQREKWEISEEETSKNIRWNPFEYEGFKIKNERSSSPNEIRAGCRTAVKILANL